MIYFRDDILYFSRQIIQISNLNNIQKYFVLYYKKHIKDSYTDMSDYSSNFAQIQHTTERPRHMFFISCLGLFLFDNVAWSRTT
jgi:hypothetical protein